MTLLELSIVLNIYLVMGIVFFGLSKTNAAHCRAMYSRQFRLYWLYVSVMIVLWPAKPFLHYLVREKVLSPFG